MGIAGRTFAIVRMTGQMRFMCIGRIVMRQFVFAVVVRFVTAAAGAMLMSVVMAVVVPMVVTVVVIVAVVMVMFMIV